MQGSRAPKQKNQGSSTPPLLSRAPFSQNQYFCLGCKKSETLCSGLQQQEFLQRPPLWDPDLGSKCCRKQVKPQLCRPPVAFVQLYHNVISGAIKVNPAGGAGKGGLGWWY